MNRSTTEERMTLLKHEACELFNDIISNNKKGDCNEIPQKCNNLTKFLFSHQYMLYSDLNKYFESSGIMTVLIGSLTKLPDQSKRDVLRLMHMLLHANRTLRDEVRRSEQFQLFLRKCLEQNECWENRKKYKHQINIASQLLVDRDGFDCSFNVISVRKLVRKMIDTIVSLNIQENEDVIPCVVFYACSMTTAEFEEVPRIPEDDAMAERILTKEVTAGFIDIIRDYIQDFKVFYSETSEFKRNHFLLYRPKSGFSFQQMCNTITFYAIQNKNLRMNIFQSGIYGLINNVFSINYIPESLLCSGLYILKLPLLDEFILRGVKTTFLKPLNEKLNHFLKREGVSEKTRLSIKDLLKSYDAPEIDSFDIPSGEVIHRSIGEEDSKLIQLTGINMNQNGPGTVFGFEKWGRLDIEEWLTENHLGELKETLSKLTGRGLKQLHLLITEKSKMEIIDYLMAKMGLSFEITLELIGALEAM